MGEDKNDTSSCASCGIAEVDDIKLKECANCDLVRYCSDDCEKNHKSQHEEACKKRAAELREELLFKQPESTHRGDCPICYLPLPLDVSKSIMTSCCFQIICMGCAVANRKREKEASLGPSCLFCRKSMVKADGDEAPVPHMDEEFEKRRMERIEANDPVAIHEEGIKHFNKEDYSRTFEWLTKAAALGNAESHFQLALLYDDEVGVEKNRGKEMYHAEEAAIAGHPGARCLLGKKELDYGNYERAAKHWIIAANNGHDKSMKDLMDAFKRGFVSKEVLAATLRAHQAAVDATKSPQREYAEEYLEMIGMR